MTDDGERPEVGNPMSPKIGIATSIGIVIPDAGRFCGGGESRPALESSIFSRASMTRTPSPGQTEGAAGCELESGGVATGASPPTVEPHVSRGAQQKAGDGGAWMQAGVAPGPQDTFEGGGHVARQAPEPEVARAVPSATVSRAPLDLGQGEGQPETGITGSAEHPSSSSSSSREHELFTEGVFHGHNVESVKNGNGVSHGESELRRGDELAEVERQAARVLRHLKDYDDDAAAWREYRALIAKRTRLEEAAGYFRGEVTFGQALRRFIAGCPAGKAASE